MLAWLYRSAIHINRWQIHSADRHHAGRCVLIAAADGHQAVKALRVYDNFNGIGDDFPAWQRIKHSFMSHGYAV
ncbi:hypothetical protein D3C72_2496700 [compost metagenome]